MEAAFFDLDKTVIAKASLVAFGRPLYDAGMISRWLVVRAMWSNLVFHYLGADDERMHKFRSSALRITRGWDQALVSAIVRDTLVEVIEPIVYAEALDLIHEHRAAGRRVFLISASPEEIVAPLAQFLGVDEAIASRAELDDEGRYTGNVEFFSYGPYKAEAIRQAAERHGIDLSASYAYTDSATDLPMLEAVGHPVAVNPDRDLARVARDRGWQTRWFEHGVPLRERVTMPQPSRVITVGAGVAAVAAGTTIVWWWVSTRDRPGGMGTPRSWAAAVRSGRAPVPPVPPPATAPVLRRVVAATLFLVGRAAAGTATLVASPRSAGASSLPASAPGRRRGSSATRTGRGFHRGRRTPPITRPAASSPRRLRGRGGRRSR